MIANYNKQTGPKSGNEKVKRGKKKKDNGKYQKDKKEAIEN